MVWILIDDVGFGASSAFGGPARTPTIDKLANNGLRYTNFHTTAVCSPSRAALLTGGTAGGTAGASVTKDKAKVVGAYSNVMAIFTVIKGGLMYEISAAGQKFKFKPR